MWTKLALRGVAGPLAGAVVANLLTHALHGPYTEAEQQAAQGED